MVARNQGNQTKSFLHAPVVLAGSFTIVAGPVMGVQTGRGFTATRVGVGDYLITATDGTHTDNYQSLQDANVIVQHTAGAGGIADIIAKVGVVNLAAAGGATFQILTHDLTPAIAVAEVPADDAVHFVFLLGNSEQD